MGKRELLIAAAFLIVGFGVYRLTAPPGNSSGTGFSVGRIVDEIRREIRGEPGRAETTFAAKRDVPDTVSEIRLSLPVGTVSIVGEERDDIEAEMHVRSTGSDEAEAERLAKESHLAFDEAGALIIIAGKFPQAGRQTPTLKLKIPSRLGVRLDDKQSTLEISNVASVLIGSGRGRTVITKVQGSVSVTQRGSEIVITDVGSIKLNTFSAEAKLTQVRDGGTFSLQGGELRAEGLGGSLEIESRNTEMQFDKLDALKGNVRVNATLGEVVFNGLRADTRIDARRTEIRIDHAGGAPLSIYNDGDETIEITVPPAGFTLDARATDGQISLDASLESLGLKKDTSGTVDDDRDGGQGETRVSGSVRGGGPRITLRANHGDIVVRGR